jgi:hypothetical protein
MRRIKAVICKASDINEGLDSEIELEFKNYNDMVKWMKNVYWNWIIKFPDSPSSPSIYKKLKLIVYDDYME